MVGALRTSIASSFLHCALVAFANEATQDGRFEERHSEVTATATATSSLSVCDARTINHITHTLPQLCLTRAWTNTVPSYNETAVAATSPPDGNPYESTSNNVDPKDITSAPSMNSSTAYHGSAPTESEVKAAADIESAPEAEIEAEVGVESETETDGAPFMSFEDWKEMMLRQTGQDPQDMRSQRAAVNQDERRIPPDIGDFGLGEEDEISLDFENYLNRAGSESHETLKDSAEGTYTDDASGELLYEGNTASLHRSKDAGKTCKERFSYSSFDAGATILKTGRGTKNAKAILIENKDSYMLLECGADSKYVIVELSDDILIDTVVLANFEFFSSMVRQFRVSVSDRYPVKMDRWREIGSFEARNSRDIQAFLVENPQIWAKYVRIEFQTHYGNEYYCPVSLLRIHGSRMLDSWKDMDGGREEEMLIDEDEFDSVQKSVDVPMPSRDAGAVDEPRKGSSRPELDYTPWPLSPLENSHHVCQDVTDGEGSAARVGEGEANSDELSPTKHDSEGYGDISSKMEDQSMAQGPVQTPSLTTNATVIQETSSGESSSAKTPDSWTTSSTTNSTASPVENPSPPTKASSASSPGPRLRGSGTMSAPGATPTVQEGFFNAITKRLHHAEANLTLTMQYLEDHSRNVQESLQRAEQKQLSKVTAFLDNLNQTVLAELRGMRDQYDQIWQSTVIALETQREQADRDIVALSSRLNLLADEVVFQKRMAIVQAVLLLCCLFLVIFSRGVPIPYLAPLLDQAGANIQAAPPDRAGDDLSSRPLYTSQSRQDDVENDQPETWSSSVQLTRTLSSALPSDLPSFEKPAEENGSRISCESAVHTSSSAPRHARLSPPLTPSFEASSPATAELVGSNCDADGPPPRRLPAYHAHASHSRKPLPALPEHPSPERPSSR